MLSLPVQLCTQRRFGHARSQQIHCIQHTVRSQRRSVLVVRNLIGVVGGTGTALPQEQVTGIEQIVIATGNGTDCIQDKRRDIEEFFVIFHRACKVLPSRNADAAARRNAGLFQQGA